jgi:hypothetical protein
VIAVIKVATTSAVACASVVAAIVESGHPLLVACACAAFVIGIGAAECVRAYRKDAVRSWVS